MLTSTAVLAWTRGKSTLRSGVPTSFQIECVPEDGSLVILISERVFTLLVSWPNVQL
jgi:hypothetical protein